MHSHLAIIGKNGELALKPDQSITITDKNPMFNDQEMFSQPIPLPFDLNRHVLKNMDDVNSAMRSTAVNGDRYQIVVDGIPLRTATMKVQDAAKMDGTIDVNFDATNRTFKDMIADMRCRDVDVDDDILIGEKVGDVDVTMQIIPIYKAYFAFQDGVATIVGKLETKHEVFQPFALGYSYPGECEEESGSHNAKQETPKTYHNPNKQEDLAGDKVYVKVPKVAHSYINTSNPYPAAKYCNSRIAYAHHKAGTDDEGLNTGETSDEIVPSNERDSGVAEDKSPYWVLDANRPASGICFYVAYFLECLFKKLGVAYDMTALTSIEDFNYLAFFSTQCHYDTKPKEGVILWTEKQINQWLESRGCGGKMKLDINDPKYEKFWTDPNARRFQLGVNDYTSITYQWANPGYGAVDIRNSDGSIDLYSGWHKMASGTFHNYEFIDGGSGIVNRGFSVSTSMTAKVMQMFANSDNFPDANVTEVIESLENSFGVRFCYDAEINKVTVKLMRDMFRDKQSPIPFKGKVLRMVKMTENIRGIRMKYSAESDAQEQRDNIRYGKRDYDTVYDYMDYPQGYTELETYENVTEKIDVGNRTGYCDLRTGNFYRVKVSSDASSVSELRPAVFEVGAMHGVELGDCSQQAEDDDAIKEFVSNFQPIEVNDVAFVGKNYSKPETPMLVPFIDEDMEHEFLIKKMLNPVSTQWGSIDIIYELCLMECYDPTKTDDGQSPLQHHDWGLTIGFLRPGSGTTDPVDYDPNYDGFGNSRWLISSKEYSINSDTYDEHGNFIGANPATSFSLKPRAYKPFRYKYEEHGGEQVLVISTDPKEWDDPSWLIPCNDDIRNAKGIITKRLRSRGTCDTWMIELFRLLLEGQKYYVEALCTAAELADIPNKWLRRWEIDGKVGWLNLLTYPIDVEKGIGKVEIEFFAL